MPEIAPVSVALERVPFFAHLEEDELEGVRSSGRRRSVDRGRVIFDEGDDADGMYVVLAGKVKLFRSDGDGGQVQVAAFEAGGFFGEPALLEGRPRASTAVALEASEFFVLERDEFLARLKRFRPEALIRVLAALSRASREASERMWERERLHARVQSEMELERHRSLAQMVAGVAHELNTPLGLAHASADLIENRCSASALAELAGADPAARAVLDDVIEASSMLRRNAARAHALVETFKQVSVRQINDVVETVDVAQVVHDVVALFAAAAHAARLDVRVVDRRGEDARAWTGSAGQLTQVLLNLLSNAARYAYPDARGVVEIVLASADLDGARAVELSVRDFGRGIAGEHRSRVFEPFFTTGRGRGGTGLGLTIVHGIVTSAMSGAIRLESEVDKGTAVTVTLPERSAPMH